VINFSCIGGFVLAQNHNFVTIFFVENNSKIYPRWRKQFFSAKIIPKFILGGDDVHQLCEAGEEEFLEIMALVGMASKPLHVRRLQKSLQEWVQNPGKTPSFVNPHFCLFIDRNLETKM
jgi:hypothetical protein